MGWKRVRSTGRRLAPALLLTLALAMGSRNTGRSQSVIRSVSNGTITAGVGVSGQPSSVTPALNAAGRLGVAEAGASGATLLSLATSVTKQSFVTVQIDGGPPTPGVDANSQTSPGWNLIFGDTGTNALDGSAANAKTDQGAWLQTPTVVNGNQIVARWTTLPGGNTQTPPIRIPSIEVDLVLTLVHDMVSYEFTVINRDLMAHSVALRFGQDYEVPGGQDAPVFLPNEGSITHEVDLTGTMVPPYWRATNQSTGKTVGALLTDALGKPARVTFGDNGRAVGPLWDFTADTTRAIVDGGSGVYFFGTALAPGQSRTVRTAFGKMHSTIEFGTPMAAGVDGPLTLTYDPTQPVGQQLTPNPMTVTAFAVNLSQINLTNITATISLPTGLALAAGQQATKTLAAGLPSGSEATTSWSVVPTAGASGHLDYTVSFAAGPGTIGTSVVRGIDIPALPSQGYVAGWQMVSFPYTFDDPTPATALGISSFNFDLVRWDQGTARYVIVSTLAPGQAYWLRLNAASTISLQGPHPVSTSSEFELALQNGWNQVGNPFLLPIKWSDVRVISTDPNDADRYKPLPVSQASDALHRWILPTVYWFDTRTGAYAWSQDLGTDLTPFVGYWVRSLKPGISLLLPVPTSRAASLPPAGRSSLASASGWQVRLVASAGGVTDGFNYIGMRSGAADGYDASDVEKPPAPNGSASLAIVHTDWGSRAGSYARDIRPLGGQREWTVQVNGGAPNKDVTLTWPDIRNLPKSYELYISDGASGQRLAMRQASSLRVHTGDSGVSRVTITAEPRTAGGAFRIVNWSVSRTRASGSVAIDITTSQDASLKVRVLNSSGQVLRTIGSRASTGRVATIVWDYRDGKGIAVPSGLYMIEVRGTTPDGQSAVVPIPHVVTR